MRSPKTVTCLAIAVLLIQSTGCYTLRPLEGQLPESREGTIGVHRTIRVTKTDGEEVTLAWAWKDSVAFGGVEVREGRQGIREIPVADVVTLRERRFSLVKTVLAAAPIGAVVLLMVVVGSDPWLGG